MVTQFEDGGLKRRVYVYAWVVNGLESVAVSEPSVVVVPWMVSVTMIVL